MLKIKDNVDLKELEKFEFKKQPKPYKGYYICIARGIKILMVCPNGMIMTQEHIKEQIASTKVINRYMIYYTT